MMCLKGIQPHERIFPFTHDKMIKQMRSAAEKADLPRIRVHGLRHSYVSLLIDLGFPAPARREDRALLNLDHLHLRASLPDEAE